MRAGRKPADRPTPANSNTRLSTGLVQRMPAPAISSVPPTPANSNARTAVGLARRPVGGKQWPVASRAPGLAASRLRERMVERLRQDGIRDPLVLEAMLNTPRHAFVDEALASRAYENAALPIGHGQTISQPRIVAHMIATARHGRELRRVLEVGSGCGYQAAVLAGVAREIYSVERVRALHAQASARLKTLRLPQVRLILGDGSHGLPAFAPFDAIIVAAAGLSVPDALLAQLAPGGRLVAPEGSDQQRLVVIERQAGDRFRRIELEAVRFVPLQTGVQL